MPDQIKISHINWSNKVQLPQTGVLLLPEDKIQGGNYRVVGRVTGVAVLLSNTP